MYIIPENEYLEHYGVLGMKWGVRKDKDKASIKKYKQKIKDANKKANDTYQEYNKASLGGLVSTKKSRELSKQYAKDIKNVGFAKQDLDYEKTRQRMSNSKTNKYREKYQKEFENKGYSKEDAAIEAYKKDKMRKTLMVIGGVTLTAGAIYGAKKLGEKYINSSIKANIFQNISTDSSKDIRDVFYASLNKSDNKKYLGLYGKELSDKTLFRTANGGMDSNVYKKIISRTSPIKMASTNAAKNTLKKLVDSDPEYKKMVSEYFKDIESKVAMGGPQGKILKKGIESFKKGKIDNSVYKAFNLALPAHNMVNSNAIKSKFYSQLKNEGFGAILDLNDKYYSGYKSKKPVIIFDKSKINVSSVAKVGKDMIEESYNKEFKKMATQNIISEGSKVTVELLGLYGAGKVVTNKVNTKTNDKIVSEYKKEHPNTQLSYNEILRIYNNE